MARALAAHAGQGQATIHDDLPYNDLAVIAHGRP